MEIKRTALIVFFTISLSGHQMAAQFSLIAGFNFYNQLLESGEYGFLQSDNGLNLFFLSPELGIKYQFNNQHSVRYLKSYQLTAPRYFLDVKRTTIFDIRSLDRLNYLFSFKNRSYVTTGLTYHVYKSENYFPIQGSENYAGNFGFNLGYGKEFNHGFIEISNLFAFEFSEQTPADLFGFWVVDMGYYIPLKKQERIELKTQSENEKTVFGFGLVGSISGFNNRSIYPSATLLQTYWGTDVHYYFNQIDLGIFWRRTTSIFAGPSTSFSPSIAAAAQWNNLGLRKFISTKKEFHWYASVSYLSGYDAVQYFPEYPAQGEIDFTIRGLTLGAGVPVKNWAFELTADCYLDVPLPKIEKGFRWDRIKASVIYNLPIITK